jgi:hypothetical protein
MRRERRGYELRVDLTHSTPNTYAAEGWSYCHTCILKDIRCIALGFLLARSGFGLTNFRLRQLITFRSQRGFVNCVACYRLSWRSTLSSSAPLPLLEFGCFFLYLHPLSRPEMPNSFYKGGVRTHETVLRGPLRIYPIR